MPSLVSPMGDRARPFALKFPHANTAQGSITPTASGPPPSDPGAGMSLSAGSADRSGGEAEEEWN